MSHKYDWIRFGTSLIILLAIAGFAHAQISYKIPTGFGSRQGLPFDLLEVEAVQKDLGLSAETAYKLSLWKASVQPHQKATRSVAFSPDRTLLVSASDDGTVKLWRIDDSTEPVMAIFMPTLSLKEKSSSSSRL